MTNDRALAGCYGGMKLQVYVDIFWALAGALLLTFAFPLPDVGALAWVGLVPVLVIALTSTPRRAFRVGYLTGVFHALALLRWMAGTVHQYGGIPWIAAVAALALLCLYLGLYLGFFAWGLSRWRRGRVLFLFFAPLFWVALEFLRTYAVTGFPWGLLGYTQHQNLTLIQLSDITGVYGVSFLVVLVNAACALLVYAIAERVRVGNETGLGEAIAALVVAGVFVGGAHYYGAVRLEAVEAEQEKSPLLSVAVIQGNIDQAVKWDSAYQLATVGAYVRLSTEAASLSPDLVVWPETAAPFYYLNPVNRRLSQVLNSGLPVGDSDWIIGAPAAERVSEEWSYYNRAFAVNPQGALIGSYDKVHLVPFGEYIPYQNLLFFVKRLVVSAGTFTPGTKGDTIKSDRWNVGIQICFESIFPELSVASVRGGATLLVNLTNDAWFGRSGAPYQHFQMARFRAVETRRALARSANTGISGFVAPSGRVQGTTPLYEEAWRVAELPVLTLTSAYVRFGDLFAWGCVFLALLLGPALGSIKKWKEAPIAV